MQPMVPAGIAGHLCFDEREQIGVDLAAVSALRQKKHLVFKRVRAERPAVAEDNGLSAAPIFIIDVDVARVFFADSDIWHDEFLLLGGFLNVAHLKWEPTLAVETWRHTI